MTVASQAPPVPVDDLEEAFSVVRGAGYRLTAARRLLLEALFVAEGPVSAEYIAAGLEGRVSPSDLPSIYRNLETLEAVGLVRHFHLGHGPGLYVLSGRAEREYLACERCGRVTSVDAAELDPVRDRIRKAFGHEASFRHFPMLGLCAECAATGAPERARLGPRTYQRAGGEMESEDHRHDHPHTHRHEHDGETHSHPHTRHDHDHTEHEHEHSHGDRVHKHAHVHEKKLERDHDHEH